ncbi:hybrid sensor histidine kinase/response regulator [Phocaeicola sartorii]|uniref:hybrid sensor histidine kinase/response regulator n=1 Tax=Phocaeicola sartorii TaxID=671267 RepID=UPI0013627B83|nr:hybrid sensor histidine kinase/response regulator [Phocaeicola sartorii]NBH68401.1 response regulator [Phocaeicola sartorii]
MKISNLKLYGRVLLGYIIVVFTIVCISLIFIYQKFKLQELIHKKEQIDFARSKAANIPLYFTKLASISESVFIWNYDDYIKYQNNYLETDSALQEIKIYCKDFINANQIDTLCNFLQKKEYSLVQIMEIIKSKEKSDSIFLITHIPKKILKTRVITRKKKGIAGFFGKTETVHEPYFTIDYSNVNRNSDFIRKQYLHQIESQLDSLQYQNEILNKQLYDFIYSLDKEIQNTIIEYNKEIAKIQKISFYLIAVIITIALVLLIISFIIIRSDLYKEEKIKFKLQQVIRENGDLLEMRKKIILTVSHDIRGPLGNIHNCADLVSETREKKKREIYLDDIRHSCHHILHLVNNLMDAYRINEAGDLRNDIPFHLDHFLQRISDEFSRKANVKALILYTAHENSILTVKGDADKLEQILDNLLTNAIKFTPSGSIRFYTKYSDGKLQVEISDTGIGMDSETLKRIFAPFERAAQNVNSDGFGLGLFLTKGLIKVLEGKMDVESTLGKGSMFRLELPLPETDELVEEDNSDCNLITMLPKNVLVVDDDPIQLKIAEDMLGRKGISCKTCMNVCEVVAALGNSEYDLVLTDVQMPDTDGFGLLRLLRNSDIGNSRTIPVAVMTARSDGNSGIYEKEGFAGCIHKPFNIHGLLAFLSSVVSRTQVSVSGDFDFSSLLENTDDHCHMLSLVVMESEKELEEMESADRITDRETMRKIIHRMMPVWEMLGKDNILRDFQRILHDSNIQNETIHEHAIQIMEWLKILIEETKKELKKYENTDS